jgi:hypothetical protein
VGIADLVPIAALGISFAGILFTWLSLKSAARRDEFVEWTARVKMLTDELETVRAELVVCKRDLAECHKHTDRLERRIVESLLKKDGGSE